MAAVECGIKPLWSSEIDEFPMAVSKYHFPDTVQLGDITKINGTEIEPVDIVCSGSPCQGLSVAGKRKGLDDDRSGLFMESIRVVREMQAATNGEYPRWFCWENVSGAYSSNKGDDFRTVLEEITEANIPMPKSGRWAKAGMVRSDKCNLAWRTLDAQYWGVPQRRARIFLIASFTKDSAPEVLFESESSGWNLEASTGEGQGAPNSAAQGTDTTSWGFEPGVTSRDGRKLTENKTPTLRANMGDNQTAVVYGICAKDSNSMKSSNPNSGIYEATTTRTLDLNGGNPACNQGGMAVVEQRG